MSQNDFVIANQTAPNFRADLNLALQALASTSSGSTAPSTTYANMLWYDTANNILKMRTEADDAWVSVAYVDQSTNAWRILDDTQVVNTSGTQTGLLGDQTTATWEAGTGTTESLVSPAKVRAADTEFRDTNDLGWGQTWQDVTASRSAGTSYQNTTGRPITVVLVNLVNTSVAQNFEVSNDNSTWFTIRQTEGSGSIRSQATIVVPNLGYYRIGQTSGTTTFTSWTELR